MTKPKFITTQWGTEARNNSQFAQCCGSKFVCNPSDMLKPYRGIRVAVGAIVEPHETKNTVYEVVQTKNGPLTVGIRNKWR